MDAGPRDKEIDQIELAKCAAADCMVRCHLAMDVCAMDPNSDLIPTFCFFLS